ncbi:MAG: hypothetical protein A3E32_02065 [Candidatus Zambryskibacteria bacterium RIFCSPHIGHO2_12_FULL_38_37]|uniref:Transmembrane protein n=1 Tax=Candidatus Zambryskibacteria bacterium RIFCSPHIGHO2_12_FULL_38_37 TaxID=1802751 RepID=A0A1G2TR80_9BACT|nr:MAG: hypothetical protein A3E32_02065 [Candidatus Zambryskibacteria bacterium RIFCSPHIGHO2_12_FULL_38_37]
MLSGTTIFLRSRSVAPPSPRHHAFFFLFGAISFFSVWWWRERGRVSPKGETDGILVLIRWTRFCEHYFLGKGFRKTETNFFGGIRIWIPPAERGLGNECGWETF